MSTTKKTIRVDQDKCTGCGLCVSSCPAGALAMVDGKAQLVRADHCDQLGVCIGECPFDAIEFVDVEESTAVAAAPVAAKKSDASPCGCPSHANQVFDVIERPAPEPEPEPEQETLACGCPGHVQQVFETTETPEPAPAADLPSQLTAWPIQLHLVQPTAPQFLGADVVIAASCSAFSHGNFHKEFLEGRGLIIACPKLDRQEGYLEKLTQLFRVAQPKRVTVVRMEVPCCSGLTAVIREARNQAGTDTPVVETTIGLSGGVKSEVAI